MVRTARGRQRHYLVIRAARLQAGASVLLVFHPSMSSGEDMRRMVGSAIKGIVRRENNLYGGGRVALFGFGDRGNVLSAQESAQWFAHRLGLAATEPQALGKEISGLSARQQDWRSTNWHVRLVTIEGGGHTVPQTGYRFMRLLGGTFHSDSVLESMWKLLAENKH